MKNYTPTLSVKIADEIIRLIAMNEIKPNSKITEKELMDRFGVSQSVVREARLSLESRGLLSTFPRTGTYVNNPTFQEISMLFEVRKSLDVFAGREAANHHTSEDLDDLQELSDAAEQMYENKNYLEFFRLSREFHKRIYECSGFHCLARIYDSLTTLTDLYHYNIHSAKHIELVDDVIGHKEIFDAIRNGDPDLCEEVIVRHIEKTQKRDLQIWESSIAESQNI